MSSSALIRVWASSRFPERSGTSRRSGRHSTRECGSPAAERPLDPDAQVAWIYDWWQRLDKWIEDQGTELQSTHRGRPHVFCLSSTRREKPTRAGPPTDPARIASSQTYAMPTRGSAVRSLLAAESQQADIVADPLARELPQIAFEQFQYLRRCQALPVAQNPTQSVRAVAAPAPSRFD